ncbi:MAG TPA: hypothetical protein ENJ84_08110 [Gammaproteobacteria bacterium]|nr:hypothetical protein [Gammaproteobacteria bacterium]
MTDLNAVNNKLQAARTRLILDKPFLGALVLRLPMVQASSHWCKTTATDARKFYFNAEFIARLSASKVQFVLAHEALHCALSHFARRQHRVKAHWDAACDYAINPLLIEDGLEPPEGSLYLREFEGMTAEEIYPCIHESETQTPLDHHVYDDDHQEGGGQPQSAGEGDSETRGKPQASTAGADSSDEDSGQQPPSQDNINPRQDDSGSPSIEEQAQGGEESDESGDGAPRPNPLSRQEIETLSTQWQQRMVGAAQQAMQAGKMGGAMSRMINFMRHSRLPWRMLLDRYVSSIARDDYNYSRPSARRGDPAIFPSLRSAQLNMGVVVDTSGSVGDQEIGEFLSEVNAIKSQMRCQVTLMACDAELARGCPWVFEPWEELKLPDHIQGGGGTRFTPPFEHLNQADIHPDVVIYFTDAQGQFPETEPYYPVIWLVKGKQPVPWGQRVQLN